MAASVEEQSQVLPNADSLEKLLQIVPCRPTENDDLGCPMPKVPPLVRQDQNKQQDYDPVIVSLGPYHHGKTELQLVEGLKTTALQTLVNRSSKDARHLYHQVFERVNDARRCYIKDSTKQYDDKTFAQMMLLDACFIIVSLVEPYCMTNLCEVESTMIFRDMILLENQIPFWLLSQLMCLVFGEDGDPLLYKRLYEACFGDYEGSGKAWRDDDLPHHLLHACWRILFPESRVDKSIHAESMPSDGFGCLNHLPNFSKRSQLLRKYTFTLPCFPESRGNENDLSIKKHIHCFRSAIDLKSKGIQLRPSSANSLKDIVFQSGYFYSELKLPVWIVTVLTKPFFLNMIAYEMCGNTGKGHWMAAYIEFMKSLIDSPKDVKELREKRILLNTLGSDEEVVKVYKEIKTFGMENILNFHATKKEIQDHYNSKAKTWLAELFYTYFRSPWTVIALFAAAFLLVLTFLQTYYTIRPS